MTLGTMTIFKGLGYIAAGGNSISGLPESFKWLGQGYIGPIPVPVAIMVLVMVAGAFVLNKTYFGRYIFALGGNEEAARLAGVNINRMKIFVFAHLRLLLGDHFAAVALAGLFRPGDHGPGYGVRLHDRGRAGRHQLQRRRRHHLWAC